LYFSSKGFSGYGGSDIYRSIRLDDTWTNWTEPENLGPEINSKFDDLFFNIPSSSEYAYFSKGVTDNNIDIFRLKLPAFMKEDQTILVKGKLLDAKTKSGIGAKIIYESLPDGKQIGSTESNPETGDYEIRLPVGKMYGVHAESDGHISTNQNLDLRKTAYESNQNINLSPIELVKVEKDVMLTLNNIFFDYNKSVLKPESFPELDRLVKLMDGQATMEVEISGHTDPAGPADYNMKLSEKRANSVASYLIDKGIVKGRIKVTFFGESRLIDKSNTPEGNKKNRRVEFKILKT
jgi:outer membrane protein OmpA-like peptidoglycan-associated protein